MHNDGPKTFMSDSLLEHFVKQYIESQTTPNVLFLWHGGETMMRPLSFYQKALELQKKYGYSVVVKSTELDLSKVISVNLKDKDVKDYAKAIEYYKHAIAADTEGNALFLAECDEIMELINAPIADRYDLFNGKEALYEKRYDSETKALKQRILKGEYADVLEKLQTRFYSRREHIEDLHDIYVDVCLLSGFEAWEKGDNDAALKFMLLSNEYPENHGYAHLEYYARDAQVYYNIGLAYEKVGNKKMARKYYKMASEVVVKPADGIYNYEKGLAMLKLNANADVSAMYQEIVAVGEASVTTYVQRFWESFDRGPYEQDINAAAYYMQGVGYMAQGNKEKAGEMFKKALVERNDHLWANYYLGNL